MHTQACSLLVVLLADSELAEFAGTAGAAKAVVAAMAIHKHAGLQEKAAWALMNLGAQVHANKDIIVAEGGMEASVAAMNRLPKHAGVQRQVLRSRARHR